MKINFIVLFFLLISTVLSAACGGTEEPTTDITETLPTTAPAETVIEPPQELDTAELLAHTFPQGTELLILDEGALSRNPIMAATGDGFKWGALVKNGNEVSWILNGDTTSISDGEISDFAVSTDLSRYAHVSNDVVVVDGKQVDQGSTSCCPIFSNDGSSFGYIADDSFVVINGTASKSHLDTVDNLVISPDGTRSAYIVGGNTVVVDGEEKPKYDSVSTLTFSPDGSRFAYIANDALLVVDGEEQDIGETTAEQIVFSPDSSRLAHVRDEMRLGRLFVDEKEYAAHRFGCAPSLLSWGCITFTSDSESIAYTTIIMTAGSGHTGGTTALQFRLVQDGKRQRDAVGCCLVASPEGAHVAYVSKGFTIMIDGRSIESEASSLTDAPLVFGYEIKLDLPGGLVPADLVFSTDGELLSFLLYETDPSTSSVTKLYLEELDVTQ